jgi:calpain-15
LRSEEIFTNPQIFSLDQEINPNDIKQGALNNCYFLSVLSALAEYPERIRSLFLSQEKNSVNIYGVRLCIDGTWEEIVIDNFFPCDGRKKSPCFSSGGENNLWVMIIEKCYAKAYGSYHKIEGGIPEHAMRDLTGAPTLTLDNSSENLLSSLKEACEKRWIITASAGETDASKDLLKEVGLIPLHAYTILEVHEINIENDIHSHNNLTNSLNSLNGMNSASVEYLLKIRNPWGKNEWIGDWSDFSNLWKENLKLSSPNCSKNQGCFFMNFKDFKHYFSKIQICRIHDNYQYSSIKLTQEMNSYCLVKMKIKQNNNPDEEGNDLINNMPSFISLIHKDKKKSNFFNTNDFKYPTSRFIICKINSTSESESLNEQDEKFLNYNTVKDEYEYIFGKMGQEREIFEEKELESGEYLIFIEIDWTNNTDNNTGNNFSHGNGNEINPKTLLQINKIYPFVLSTYSSNQIELSIEDKSDPRYKVILQKIYVSCAKKNNNVVRFTNEDAPNCYKYTNVTPEGYAYIYFENKEEDATLIEDVKYTKFEGLRLLPPFYGTSYYVKIGPGESKIVLIKQVDLTGFNLIYSYQ